MRSDEGELYGWLPKPVVVAGERVVGSDFGRPCRLDESIR
jgi:hypothetical protein